MPVFSVVIPLYNKAKYIKTCIDSVFKQTYRDYEVVIVDDGSTDNGVEVIQKSYNSNKIRIVQKENGGPSSARNNGVKEANGEWVVFLDADDVFLPNALFVFSKLIKTNADINYFVCNYYIAINGKAKLFSDKKYNGVVKNPFYLEAIRELTDRPGSSAIKRELLLKYPFNEKLRRYEDAESQYEMMRTTPVYQCSTPVMISNRDAGCASFYRKDINEDFVGSLEFNGKSFWEEVTLYHLALDCKKGYPQYASKYEKIYKRLDLKLTFFLIKIYWYLNKRFKIRNNSEIAVSELLKTEHYESYK